MNNQVLDPQHIDDIAAGGPPAAQDFAPLIPPIMLSTTFLLDGAAALPNGGRLIYARQSNPTNMPLESQLAQLDGGEAAMVFTSGMAGICTVFSALKRGEEAIVPLNIYWPLRLWLETFDENHAFSVRWIPDTDPETIKDAINEHTRIIWLEAISNPALRVADLPAIAALKPKDCMLVVDATCASPALLRPLQYGADMVAHSAGKCLSGHHDLLGGCVIAKDQKSEFWSRIAELRWAHGNALGSLESYLLMRSLPTLPTRMRQSSASALRIATFLEQHPAVARVNYPGLKSHPDHQIAEALMSDGKGVLIGIDLVGGEEACTKLCSSTRLWKNATSFGGVTSLIEHRKAVEYKVSQSAVAYVRLSTGLENPESLIEDLARSLA